MGRNFYIAAIAGAWLLGVFNASADGCFVFVWNKQKDINEPAQKAIILHDHGREDMVLQVRYEGLAEDFGWLIPVPGLPEVRQGSMDCFYEASRLTQQRFGTGERGSLTHGAHLNSAGEDPGVNVIRVKTVGAYEVTVLSATNAASLSEWLDAHQFTFPKEKQNVLDDYIKNQWYFIVAKIDPNGDGFVLQQGRPKKVPGKTAISESNRKKLASGELHPLVISFPSEKCMFPLAISAVNGKPSEVSLYVLSSEPLASRAVFDKKFAAYSRERTEWIQQAPERQKAFEEQMKRMDERRTLRFDQMRKRLAENAKLPGSPTAGSAGPMQTWDDDPADPPPSNTSMRELLGRGPMMKYDGKPGDDFYGGTDLVNSMEVDSKDLPACCKEMPRLRGKSWWLSKQVEVFAPEEMHDLEFEPAIPILAGKMASADGHAAAICLSKLGKLAVPAVLKAWKSSNPIEHRLAASAMAEVKDARLAAEVPGLLEDADARVRQSGCYAAGMNWDAAFLPRLTKLLSDPDQEVRSAAGFCLMQHRDDSTAQASVFRKLVEEDGLAASKAITLVDYRNFSREQLVHLFSSTNLPVVSSAFTMLRHQNLKLMEIEPLLTNSLPMARMMGLGVLTQMGDKMAVDRIVAMLRDSNEGVQWNVRARLRRLTGQKLGPDPSAWEKWWAQNKDNFTPLPGFNRIEQ